MHNRANSTRPDGRASPSRPDLHLDSRSAKRFSRRFPWLPLGTLAIAASLLTFPNATAWMAACWLALFSVLAIRHCPGWTPLFVCLSLVLAKGIHWSPGSLVLFSVVSVTAIVRCVRLGRGHSRERWEITAAQIAVCWLAWAVMTLDWRAAAHCSRTPPLDPARPIVCIGDSLTAFGYPQQLNRIVSVPVVDWGRDGITTADAVKRLPALAAVNPQVVVIELGGHDFLRGYGRDTTRRHLETIIAACQSIGAEVVLMEIPRGLIRDSFHGLERELSRRHDLELIPDTPIRMLALWSPYGPPGFWLRPERRFSDDGLHPNARGNVLLATWVARALSRLYGPCILLRPAEEPAAAT